MRFVFLLLLSCLLFTNSTSAQPSQFKKTIKTIDWSRLPDDCLLGLSVVSDYSDDYVLFITGDEIYFYPKRTGVQDYPSIKLNALKNLPSDFNKVTGAIKWEDGKTLLFNGKSCITFDENMLVEELGDWADLPFQGAVVTAALNFDDNSIWLINGTNYITFSKNTKVSSSVKTLTSLPGWPGNWDNITGAVNGGDGNIYFFYSNQVLAYNIATKAFLTGFPKLIREVDTGSNGGSTSTDNVSKDAATNTNTPAPAVKTGINPIKPVAKQQKKYRDDYTFNTDINGQYFAPSSIVSSSWLGKGFNIAYVDPFDIASSEQPEIGNPIELVFSKQPSTDGKYLLHYGTELSTTAISGESVEAVSTLNSEAMRNTFKEKINMNVEGNVDVFGMGGGAAFSASTTFQKARENATTAENLYVIGRLDRTTQTYSLKLLWKPKSMENTINVTGDVKFIQKLHPDFRDAVNNLPVDGNLEPYTKLLQNWGTHFSTRVKFGGYCKSVVTMTRKSFMESNMTQKDFEMQGAVSANASLGNIGGSVKIGGGYATTTSNSAANASAKEVTDTKLSCIGGNSDNSDKSAWIKSVDERPAPLDIQFTPIFALLSEAFFEGDATILKKREFLIQAMKQYFEKVKQQYPDFNGEPVFFNKSGNIVTETQKREVVDLAITQQNEKKVEDERLANQYVNDAMRKKESDDDEAKAQEFLKKPTYDFKGNVKYLIRAYNGNCLSVSDYGQLTLAPYKPGDQKQLWTVSYMVDNPDPKWAVFRSAYTGQYITRIDGKTGSPYKDGQFGILKLRADIIGYTDCQSFRMVLNNENKVQMFCNMRDAFRQYDNAMDAQSTTPIVRLSPFRNTAAQLWTIESAAEFTPRDMSDVYQKNLGIISEYARSQPPKNLAWDEAYGVAYTPNPVSAAPAPVINKQEDEEKAKAKANQEKYAKELMDAAAKKKQEEEHQQAVKQLGEMQNKLNAAIAAASKPEPNMSGIREPEPSYLPNGALEYGAIVYDWPALDGPNKFYPHGANSLEKDWNNKISAMRIAPGYKAILYDDKKLQGASIEITGDWTIRQNMDWDNRISSFKIEPIK